MGQVPHWMMLPHPSSARAAVEALLGAALRDARVARRTAVGVAGPAVHAAGAGVAAARVVARRGAGVLAAAGVLPARRVVRARGVLAATPGVLRNRAVGVPAAVFRAGACVPGGGQREGVAPAAPPEGQHEGTGEERTQRRALWAASTSGQSCNLSLTAYPQSAKVLPAPRTRRVLSRDRDGVVIASTQAPTYTPPTLNEQFLANTGSLCERSRPAREERRRASSCTALRRRPLRCSTRSARARPREVRLYHLHPKDRAPFAEPHAGRITSISLFTGPRSAGPSRRGAPTYIPVFLSDIPTFYAPARTPRRGARAALAARPARATARSAPRSTAARAAVDTAQVVLAEINEQMPRTHGNAVGAARPPRTPSPRRPPAAGVRGASRAGDSGARRGSARSSRRSSRTAPRCRLGIGGIPDAVLVAPRRQARPRRPHRDVLATAWSISSKAASSRTAFKEVHRGANRRELRQRQRSASTTSWTTT